MGTVLPNFPASPISEVQPFTYRDNESYLKQLHRLRDYVRENLQRLNNQEIVDIAAVRDDVNSLSTAFDGDIAYLTQLIAGLHDDKNVDYATSASFASSLGLPLQIYDNFQRSDRDLVNDICSNGLSYSVMHEPSTSVTSMNIIGGVARRTVIDASSPILMGPVRSPLTAMGAEYSFAPGGTTEPTGAIIGTCQTFFGSGSIQLAVSYTGWQLFNYSGTSHIIASDTFYTPLVCDGVTRYRSICVFDPVDSSVRLTIPKGDGTTESQTLIVADPMIAANWGGMFCCIQNNVNASTDPDAIFYQMAGA